MYDLLWRYICAVLIAWWQGEYLLRTEDILDTIDKEGHNIAVIMLPGVQYYTGQVLDMKTITKAGHDKVNYIFQHNHDFLLCSIG